MWSSSSTAKKCGENEPHEKTAIATSSSFESIDLASQKEERSVAGMVYPVYQEQPRAVFIAPVHPVVPSPSSMYHQPGWIVVAPMAPLPGVPSGLEILTLVDSIIVQQLSEPPGVMLRYETVNRYILRNTLGQQLYYAFEESYAFDRQCSGKNRSFTMHIVDNFNREVIAIHRTNDCCKNVVTIEAPLGQFIGRIEEDYNCCFFGTTFTVHDYGGQVVYKLIRDACSTSNEFPLIAPRVGPIGKVTKLWSGLAQELLTDADTFGVQFPLNMHASTKAILIGATFLIDFMFFENNQAFC